MGIVNDLYNNIKENIMEFLLVIFLALGLPFYIHFINPIVKKWEENNELNNKDKESK